MRKLGIIAVLSLMALALAAVPALAAKSGAHIVGSLTINTFLSLGTVEAHQLKEKDHNEEDQHYCCAVANGTGPSGCAGAGSIR